MSTAEGPNENKDTGYEQRIVSLIQAAGSKGVNDGDIQKEIPVLTAEQRVSIINKLIAQGLLDLFNSNNVLVYKIKSASSTTSSDKLKGADNEEKIVYGIIEEAGSKGIWIRDIRFKSNLIMTTLGKILKQLEGKKMIKAVKSVAASKKKVYMLYNLEPDRSLTGGAWYCDQDFEAEFVASKKKVYMLYNLEPDRSLTGGAWYCDQDFEAEFVDVLNQQCYRYLQHRKEKTIPVAAKSGPLVAQTMAYATSKDVWKYITELGISKVQLSEDDIRTILDTLLYDGKVERILSVSGEYLYQAMESYLPPPGIVRMPCGICPIMRSCSEISAVNPTKCTYLSEWLT